MWHLRFHWQDLKTQIQAKLLNGTYQFSPCKSYKINDKCIGVWNAQDALVLKAIAIVITKHLSPKLSKNCYHLAGRGGTKACVMKIKNETKKTDTQHKSCNKITTKLKLNNQQTQG